jgi:hypothetical protein
VEKVMQTQNVQSQLSRLIRPWPVILGTVVSFLACCVAGRIVSDRNYYRDFQRFHPSINYLTLHNPTVSKVRALARSRLDRDRIAVVVGGNSVLYGSGSGGGIVWTERLQELLGEDYKVINLAMCGAACPEFGGTAAEVLSRDFPRLIFISNLWADPGMGAADPDGRPFIRYFYWDAYYHGWLLDDPERVALLASLSRDKDPAFPELRAQLLQDRVLSFRDLWVTLEYTHFSTTWCPRLGSPWTQPRKNYSVANVPDPPSAPREVLDQVAPAELKALRDSIQANKANMAALAQAGHSPTANLEVTIRGCFPEPCRRRTLILVSLHNPYYLNQLEPAERADYFTLADQAVQALQRCGFAALQVGRGFPVEWYFDTVHLNTEGGRRMAEAVAPQVRQLARKLGYTNEKDDHNSSPLLAPGVGRRTAEQAEQSKNGKPGKQVLGP